MAAIKLGYTTIQHGVRLRLGLSMNQYALAASIFHLSASPKAPVAGWCSASKKRLAAFFGFSERTVFNLLSSLAAGGWVEYHPSQDEGLAGLIRTTAAWYDTVECYQGGDLSGLPQQIAEPMQKVQGVPMQKVQRGYEESSYNTNTSTNKGNTTSVFARPRPVTVYSASPENPTTASHTEGPPENSDTSINQNPTSPEVIELADEIAKLFSVSESRFFHQYAKIRRFVKEREAIGQLAIVRAQFEAYAADRQLNKTKVHNLDNWLGTAESNWLYTNQGDPAAWAEKDWAEALAKQLALAASKGPKETGRKSASSHLNQRGAGAAAALARLRELADADRTKPETSASDE